LVLDPDRSARRERSWIVEGGYRNIYCWPVGCILKKDLCSTTRCEPSHAPCVGNTAECAANELEVFALHNAPGDIRRSRTAKAIDAMTVDESKGPFGQLIPHSTAKTASGEVHVDSVELVSRRGRKGSCGRLLTVRFIHPKKAQCGSRSTSFSNLAMVG